MLSLATESTRSAFGRTLILMLLACTSSLRAAQTAPAAWFPESPNLRHYIWAEQPCPGCKAIAPPPAWERMVALAGLSTVRFRTAPDDRGGEAYSVAPDVVVLSPSALKLKPCQLAFLVGHEIAHIARRHFDEDAAALSVYAGKPANWTRHGSDAMQLIDGDFGLALRVAHLWQDQ